MSVITNYGSLLLSNTCDFVKWIHTHYCQKHPIAVISCIVGNILIAKYPTQFAHHFPSIMKKKICNLTTPAEIACVVGLNTVAAYSIASFEPLTTAKLIVGLTTTVVIARIVAAQIFKLYTHYANSKGIAKA